MNEHPTAIPIATISPRRRRCSPMTSRFPAARWCRRSTRPRCSPSPTMPRWPTPSPAARNQPIYSRGNNPTVMEFEAKVAALEGAEAARGFSSGMAAISATVLAFVGAASASSRCAIAMAMPTGCSSGFLPRMNIKVDYVDGSDADAVAAALPGAKLLYLESPTSMMFELQDIEAPDRAGQGAGHRHDASTIPAPRRCSRSRSRTASISCCIRPRNISAATATRWPAWSPGRQAHIRRINEQTYSYLGGKLSPFEAWLLLRGLRTLPLRLPHHMKSGLTIAERLKAHPPGRAREPSRLFEPSGQEDAGRLRRAVLLRGDRGRRHPGLRRRAEDVPHRRVSWGGHESLVVPAKASLEQTPGLNSMARFGVSPRTIRFSVGLENVEDLWADIAQAFEKAKK